VLTKVGETEYNIGDEDQNGVLDVNETWVYQSSPYVVTQDDIDSQSLGDKDIDNLATVTATPLDGDALDPVTDDAEVPIDAAASLSLATILPAGGERRFPCPKPHPGGTRCPSSCCSMSTARLSSPAAPASEP